MSAPTAAVPGQAGPPVPDVTDSDQLWQYIKTGLDLIMDRSAMDYKYFMALYTCSYNYCTASRLPATAVTDPAEELYRHLEAYFSARVAALPSLDDQALRDDDALLQAYADEFTRFNTGATYANRLFTYLNRHWVKQTRDQGKEVHSVITLAVMAWQDHYLPLVQTPDDRLTSAFLRTIERARNGEGELDAALVKIILASLVDVSSQPAPKSYVKRSQAVAPPKARTIAKTHLLDPLVAATQTYYSSKADEYLADHAVGDYLGQVQGWLSAEDERCRAWFGEDHRIVGITENVLLRSRLDALEGEGRRLLSLPVVDASKGMARLLTLLARLPKGRSECQAVQMEWVTLLAGRKGPLTQEQERSLKKRTLAVFTGSKSSADVENDESTAPDRT